MRWTRRSRLIATCLGCLLVVGAAWLVADGARQGGLNHALVAAVSDHHYYNEKTQEFDTTQTALRLVREGANPNTRQDVDEEDSLWERLRSSLLLRRSKRVRMGPSVLELALRRGDRRVIAALLAAGADPNAPAEDGTSLLVCCLYGRSGEESVGALLDYGAKDVNGRDPEEARGSGTYYPGVDWDFRREPVLCWAAEEQYRGVVRRLLDRGADVNACDGNGRTALFWAVARGDLEMATLLMKRGACVDLRDRTDKTALDMARWCQSHAERGFWPNGQAIVALLQRAHARK